MKYAIIEIGGKQLVVEEGKYYAINRLPHKVGSSLSLQRVLLCNDRGRRFIGRPYIEDLVGIKITATILEHFKDSKVIAFKMRPKKKTRVTKGHRQSQTYIMINEIQTNVN
jgi:large subunit ribosomal protein L21